MMDSGLLIENEWKAGDGEAFHSVDPGAGKVVWDGRGADAIQVADAVAACRRAFPAWSRRPLEERENFLGAFAAAVQGKRLALAELISQCTGKPRWEALQEADLLPAKVENSIEAQRRRMSENSQALAGHRAVLRFRPHGVVAVLGPFNLPAHLPHSHILPALLAGNTVVFKPSEFTPAVGAFLADTWTSAGLPPGVFNLAQGGRDTGGALASHPGIDGLFFTGSYRAGLALNRLFADKPEKILALELGGNNPLVVWEPGDLRGAAALIMQSAFLTSGQRCVCARRLLVPNDAAGVAVIAEVMRWAQRLRVGLPTDDPEPFMGPLIHAQAAQSLLQAEKNLVARGAESLLPLRPSPRSPSLLSPGILDVTEVDELPDEEYFGPLLLVQRVPDFQSAIAAANATQFGLSAGLISADPALWERFITGIRAGVVNWNRQITGASGKMPFGGIGRSGNHRPSAYFAADYCQYPVASLETPDIAPGPLPPGLEVP